jgi:hypothetical protein
LFPSFDSSEDAFGVSGPDEGFGIGVGFFNEPVDCSLKVARRCGDSRNKTTLFDRVHAPMLIAEKFQLPIHFIGVGESAYDLEAFEARDFARAIAGMDG